MKIFLISSLFTVVFSSFLVASVQAKPASRTVIVPGVRIGPIALGIARQAVHKALGAPKYYQSGINKEEYKEFVVLYRGSRVSAVETTAPRFTTTGISIRSSFQTISKRYSKLSVVAEAPMDMVTVDYSAKAQGIGFGFVLDGAGFANHDAMKRAVAKKNQKPERIAVFRRGTSWRTLYSSQ